LVASTRKIDGKDDFLMGKPLSYPMRRLLTEEEAAGWWNICG
jgi:hypothetical protein